MKYSIVIPVVPKHDKYLKNVIECLSDETFLIEEIIVARSSLAPHRVNQYKKFLMKISKPFALDSKLVLSHESKNCLAYANLNRGWMLAKGKFVTFLGADDVYAPYRLRLLNEVLNLRPDANAVLHSYFLEDIDVGISVSKSKFKLLDELNLLNELVEERLIDTNEIYNSTFPLGKRDYLSECFGNTSIKIPYNRFDVRDVTHGNVVLRTDLREKLLYRPLQYGEDGVLCLDVLENFGKVYFIGLELSVYRKYLSVNRIPSHMSYIKHKILKLIPKFILKILYK